jgi:hypothetical protein
MKNTGDRLQLPQIADVGGLQICNANDGTDCNAMAERIADHFLNLVYRAYEGFDPLDETSTSSANQRRTAAYWIGGIQIDANGNTVPSGGEGSFGLDQWIN